MGQPDEWTISGAPFMHSHDRTLIASLGFADPDKANPTHDLACQYFADPETARRLWSHIVEPAAAAEYNKDFNEKTTAWYSPVDATHYRVHNGDEDRQGRIGVTLVSGFEAKAILEEPLTKGNHQYKQHVGFFDVVIKFKVTTTQTGRNPMWIRHVKKPGGFRHIDGRESPDRPAGRGWVQWHEFPPEYEILPEWKEFSVPGPTATYSIVVEVKIAPVPVGTILRQINLYRSHYANYGDPERTHWVVATAYDPHPIDIKTLRQANITFVRLGDNFAEWAAAQSSRQPEAVEYITL